MHRTKLAFFSDLDKDDLVETSVKNNNSTISTCLAQEILIYKKKWQELKPGKIALYTAVANTASLLLGIALDAVLLM